MTYTSSDPYAVTLSFRRYQLALPWIFARDLLSREMSSPTGDGDVHIWPDHDHDDDGHAVVTVELCSPQGHALIDLPTADAHDFITRSYTVVTSGEESRHLDIDAMIAALQAADPG